MSKELYFLCFPEEILFYVYAIDLYHFVYRCDTIYRLSSMWKLVCVSVCGCRLAIGVWV